MTLEVNEELLGFDAIANLLVSENVRLVSPAELQGWLVGQLASGARLSPDLWLKSAGQLLELDQFTHENNKVALVALYQQALGQLDGFGLELSLLLPDDDVVLSQRVEALGMWCQGFMSGFGHQGKQTNQSLSAEAHDALNDLSQIAQVATDVDDDEDNESDLMQLEEYIRMVALMLFAECNPPADAVQPAAQPLH